MTKQEIIEMAIQAGFFVREDEAYSPSSQEDHELTPYLRTFAKLIAKKEREAILDLVDGLAKNNTDLADAIRTRGQE